MLITSAINLFNSQFLQQVLKQAFIKLIKVPSPEI